MIMTFSYQNFLILHSRILPLYNILFCGISSFKKLDNIQWAILTLGAKLCLNLYLKKLMNYQVSMIEVTKRWQSLSIFFLLFYYQLNKSNYVLQSNWTLFITTFLFRLRRRTTRRDLQKRARQSYFIACV